MSGHHPWPPRRAVRIPSGEELRMHISDCIFIGADYTAAYNFQSAMRQLHADRRERDAAHHLRSE